MQGLLSIAFLNWNKIAIGIFKWMELCTILTFYTLCDKKCGVFLGEAHDIDIRTEIHICFWSFSLYTCIMITSQKYTLLSSLCLLILFLLFAILPAETHLRKYTECELLLRQLFNFLQVNRTSGCGFEW